MVSLQKPSKAMAREAKQNQQIEAAYRRGYHHGYALAMDLILGLLESGMPRSAVADLCYIFQQQGILPWRVAEAQGSSAPPHFDLENCQRLLREMKRRQST